MVTEGAKEREQMYQTILEQQSEIRGIQTENQRILDILLNEQSDEDFPEQEMQ